MKRHLTPAEKQTLLDEFKEHLDKVTDCKVNFSKQIKSDKKIKILYTPDAFSKSVRLVMSHTGEIAWHCLVRKKGEDYEVYDVLTYPQTTGPAHVHVKMGRVHGDGNPKDPTKYYMDWYNDVVLSMPEEEEMNLCGQCHSHVDMSTSPSGVDMNQQKEELQLKGNKGFYLFQIWNKKLDINTFLYDLEAGVLYEREDVEIQVEEDEFVKSSHDMLVAPDPMPETKEDDKSQSWWDRWKKNGGSYSSSEYNDDWYDKKRKLSKYSIRISDSKYYIDLIVEAYTATQADTLFKRWADVNEDTICWYLSEEEDYVLPDIADVTIDKAIYADQSKPLDISYEEFTELYDYAGRYVD